MKLDIVRKLSRRGDTNGAGSGGEAVDALLAGRGPLEAIEALTEANRAQRDVEIERRLVRARHEAFSALDRSTGDDDAPERRPEPMRPSSLETRDGLPEISSEDLSAETVRAALLEYGSVIVRGLVDPARAAALAGGLDRAFEARDAHVGGAPVAKTLPWFEPFEPSPEFAFDGPKWNRLKRGGASVWAPDSPRMLFELLEAFAEAGVPRLVSTYLGERPVLSMHKSVLRRVTPDTGTDWHQDGAFLGEGIRTLNVWLALSACGRDAPGLDVVPKRLDLVETGTEGAIFPWAVSPAVVEEVMGGTAPARPVFEPGDAILFDHLCLHRTATDPSMTRSRYATETWCFAPSAYPGKQVPLVL